MAKINVPTTLSAATKKIVKAGYDVLKETIEVKSAFTCKSTSDSKAGVQMFVNLDLYGVREGGFRIYRDSEGNVSAYPASTKNGENYFDNHRKALATTDDAAKAVAMDCYNSWLKSKKK